MLKERLKRTKNGPEYSQKIEEQQEIDKAEIQRLESELSASNKRIKWTRAWPWSFGIKNNNTINNNNNENDELKLQNEQLKVN